jgi:ATP-dependent helicase YprA (DUF1998 family)
LLDGGLMSLLEMIRGTEAAHRSFIEARYHIRNPWLLAERDAMMREGNQGDGIAIDPRIESAPRYHREDSLLGRGLPPCVDDVLRQMIENDLGVFNTPYSHQLEGVLNFFDVESPKDLVVMTGTGSGKTEVFFWSLLGHLAQEGARGDTIQRGLRSVIMYPMNALVTDQLGRLRKMMGLTPRLPAGLCGATIMEGTFGRVPQFMQYTSRAPYHGMHNGDKNEQRLRPIFERWLELEQAEPDTPMGVLFEELKDKGRIPEKNLQGFLDGDFWTSEGDPELFARHEARQPGNVHGGTPDILITNYAMLEYMLLRPIEDPFWIDTLAWLHEEGNEENQLLMVLDEAHLYRGAQGAEVALLLRRFMHRLGINDSNRGHKIRFILTSASFSDTDAARQFASHLTGKSVDDFAAITPRMAEPFPESSGAFSANSELCRSLAELEHPFTGTCDAFASVQAILGWNERVDNEAVEPYLGRVLLTSNLVLDAARHLEQECDNRISTLERITERLFPESEYEDCTIDTRQSAALNLVNMLSMATDADGNNLLPLRVHMMLRNLDKHFVCVNPNCSQRRVQTAHGHLADIDPPLGRMTTQYPRRGMCGCGSRMFELRTHRGCGAAFLAAYVNADEKAWPPAPSVHPIHNTPGYIPPRLLHSQPQDGLIPMALLIDNVSPHADWDPVRAVASATHGFIHIRTGMLYRQPPPGEQPENLLHVHVPSGAVALNLHNATGAQNNICTITNRHATWRFCPACTRKDGHTNSSVLGSIQDLRLKGSQPFSNILTHVFNEQPGNPRRASLPNDGKKMVAFSDSRQKAAKLAVSLRDDNDSDRFRELVLRVSRRILQPRSDIPVSNALQGSEASLGAAYAGLLQELQMLDVDLFDHDDRNLIRAHRLRKFELQPDLGLMARDPMFAENNYRPPPRFYSSLLHVMSHEEFGMRALGAGFALPLQALVDHLTPPLSDHIHRVGDNLPVLLECIVHAAFQAKSIFHRRHILNNLNVTSTVDLLTIRFDARGPQRISDPRFQPSDVIKFHDGDGSMLRAILRNAERSGVLVNPGISKDVIFNLLTDQRNALVADLNLTHHTGDFTAKAINLENIRVLTSLDHPVWVRCLGCKKLRPFAFTAEDGTESCTECAHSELEEIMIDSVNAVRENSDLHLFTRHGFDLRPALRAMNEDINPLSVLRSEEHSAQLSEREDDHDEFAKTERYELLFQDVPLDDGDQPIDVLSCTTTMEVGIDIGGITAVALRTIPPRPDNYQQRAGRAGRRGSALSTIVAYANVAPHDIYYFRHPESMIGASPTDPIIYIENTTIAERHVSASLIRLYINHLGGLPIDGGLDDVLGQVGSFLQRPFTDGTISNVFAPGWSADEFRTFLRTQIDPVTSTELTNLLNILPEPLVCNGADLDWLTRQVESMIDWLEMISDATQRFFDDFELRMPLIQFLLNELKLPKFAFPLKQATFRAEQYRDSFDSHRLLAEYSPTTDGAQALTMYSPGRIITVDGWNLKSAGVIFPNQQTFTQHRARRFLNEVHWDERTANPTPDSPAPNYPRPRVRFYNSCSHCGTVFSEHSVNMNGQDCTACMAEGSVFTHRLLEPEGFGPEHSEKSRKVANTVQHYSMSRGTGFTNVHRGERPVFTTSESRMPLLQTAIESLTDDDCHSILDEHSMTYSLRGQSVLVVNSNNGEGFQICLDCGAVESDGQEHFRPYARRRNLQADNQYPFQYHRCTSLHRDHFTLTHGLETDVFVVHVRLISPFQVFGGLQNSPSLKSACESIVEAYRRAAALRLGILPNEVAGGWRLVPSNAFTHLGILGHGMNLELFFHDTLPGGAGFSAQMEASSNDLIETVQDVLNCTCDTSCTRCLRSPDNQMLHDTLNRHWAAQLLEYITSMQRPTLDDASRDWMLDQLMENFQRKMGNRPEVIGIDDETVSFEFEGNQGDLVLQSVLAEMDDPEVTITDDQFRRGFALCLQKLEDELLP